MTTRILVVDDEPWVVQSVRSYLEAAHFEVAKMADRRTTGRVSSRQRICGAMFLSVTCCRQFVSWIFRGAWATSRISRNKCSHICRANDRRVDYRNDMMPALLSHNLDLVSHSAVSDDCYLHVTGPGIVWPPQC